MLVVKIEQVGMCPYLVVAGNAQTTNASNDFGKKVVTLCESAAFFAKNCVFSITQEMESHLRLNGINKHFLIIWQALPMSVHCLTQITMQNVAAIRQWVDHVLPA